MKFILNVTEMCQLIQKILGTHTDTLSAHFLSKQVLFEKESKLNFWDVVALTVQMACK